MTNRNFDMHTRTLHVRINYKVTMSLVQNLKGESDSKILIDIIHQDNLKDHTMSTLVPKIKKITKKD